MLCCVVRKAYLCSVKRALKYIFRTLLVLVLLVVMLAASLYLPPVQRWAVNRLTAYIEKETGLEVSIGSVHLAFPLDLSLGQVRIAKPPTDLINVEHALVDLDLTRLLSLHVGVEAIELSDGSIHTTDLIETLAMDGSIGKLKIVADDIDLKKKKVNVTEASLDGCVLDMMLREAAEEDTTESAPIDWQIDVEQLKINNSQLTVGDEQQSFKVAASIREASLDAGDINLSNGVYRVGKVKLEADNLAYDIPGSNPIKGFDVNHLAFRDVSLDLDKLSYTTGTGLLTLDLNRLAFKEKSGFQLDNLAVNLSLDDKHLTVRGLDLKTPHSSAQGNIDMDWNAFSPKERGQLKTDLQASLGHKDVLCLAEAYLPKDLVKCYPSQPLNIDLVANGNIDELALQLDAQHAVLFYGTARTFAGYHACNGDDANHCEDDACQDDTDHGGKGVLEKVFHCFGIFNILFIYCRAAKLRNVGRNAKFICVFIRQSIFCEAKDMKKVLTNRPGLLVFCRKRTISFAAQNKILRATEQNPSRQREKLFQWLGNVFQSH